MTVTNCKNIREEIDEADLNQRLSSDAIAHLQTCPSCRAFHDERGGLRSLMSSLGTVTAPADFDFRLRARLAREKDSAGGFLASGRFLFGARSLVAIGLVLLIAVAAMVIRSRMSSVNGGGTGLAINSNPQPGSSGVSNGPAVPPSGATPAPSVSAAGPATRDITVVNKEPKQRRLAMIPENNRPQVANAKAPNVAVRESGVRGPTVVTLNPTTNAGSFVVGPIDSQSFRVSIDDGHGTSHTISVPAVSFGSQRVGERGVSFAPVKSTKGVW